MLKTSRIIKHCIHQSMAHRKEFKLLFQGEKAKHCMILYIIGRYTPDTYSSVRPKILLSKVSNKYKIFIFQM